MLDSFVFHSTKAKMI